MNLFFTELQFDHNRLTYKISLYSNNKSINKTYIDDKIAEAFRQWAEHSPLSFKQINNSEKVSFQILSS